MKVVFQSGGKQKKAFDALKQKIISALVLTLPDLKQPFEIQTDASNYTMGAILLQHGNPISFHFAIFLMVLLLTILHMIKRFMNWCKV